MQATQVFEYNVEDCTNNYEAKVEYLVPLNTDCHEWVQEFDKITNTTYVRHKIEKDIGNIILQTTYKCHHSGTYQTIAGQSYSNKKPRPNQKESSDSDIETLKLSKDVHD
ncbi:15444_t:CDS:2 [Cetraspora pellucida]|uniref:15444_t:CDS:1 n=1 Tax=Cetraspora pellucida TaxID=1433469 RepID=A0A9N9EBS6_9GLOM|nr:15444_t:CDS:2 [Cetraspora pellucida]